MVRQHSALSRANCKGLKWLCHGLSEAHCDPPTNHYFATYSYFRIMHTFVVTTIVDGDNIPVCKENPGGSAMMSTVPSLETRALRFRNDLIHLS